MRSRFLYIRDMFVNACGNMDRFRATAVKEGGELNSYKCLLLVEGFIKVMNGSVMTLKEDNRFLSVWLLIHSCILCHVELHCIF